MKYKYDVAKGLRLVIAMSGLTLRELKEKTGIAFQTISTYQLGKTEPRLDIINKIVTACDSDMDSFLRYARVEGE